MKFSIVKSLALAIPVICFAGCSSKDPAVPAPQVITVQPAPAAAAKSPQSKVQLEGSEGGFKVKIETESK